MPRQSQPKPLHISSSSIKCPSWEEVAEMLRVAEERGELVHFQVTEDGEHVEIGQAEQMV